MDSYGPIVDANEILPDKRLRNRLEDIVESFASRPDSSIPEATGNRNDMDAAYEFFKNPRVTPGGVVSTSLPYTLENLQGCSRVLAVQDSTDLNYSELDDTDGLGYTDGHDTRGLKLHTTLAVRPDGLVAGTLTQQIWTRPFIHKSRAASRRHREAADKESFRWRDHAQLVCSILGEDVTVIHVADREGDIYDWFAAERPANSHLLVRVAQPTRIVVCASDSTEGHLADVVAQQPLLGQHTIDVPRAEGRPQRQATLSIRVAEVKLQPPHNARQRSSLPEVPVWVIEAIEENPPAGSKAIHWRLVTTEQIKTLDDAIRALKEYVLRWRIERFHFVLKSGFRVEKLELTTADRLANAVAVYSQAAIRVLRMTYLARLEPTLPASTEFTEEELEVLKAERNRQAKGKVSYGPLRTIEEAVRMVARLGGFLNRKGDGFPGVKVLWRGLRALHHLVLGFRLAQNAPCLSP